MFKVTFIVYLTALWSGCLTQECNSREVACNNGQCISSSYWCDGIRDCADGSDELFNTCKLPSKVRFSKGDHISGRVEIQHGGVWGSICKNDFGKEEAKVVCNMLGLEGGEVIPTLSVPGISMPIWLDRLQCKGDESSLLECSRAEWGRNYCVHSDDVAVSCKEKMEEVVKPVEKTLSETLPSQCGGSTSRVKRIVNGIQAFRGQVPWQASIRVRGGIKGEHKCGAVIITEELVLTAGHCVSTKPRAVLRVRVGDHNRDYYTQNDYEMEFKVEKVVMHPDYYNTGRPFNDIAIIKIRPNKGKKIEFNQYVQPVCLPTNQTQYTGGKMCTVSGWGKTEAKGRVVPDVLRVAEVPIISHSRCSLKEVLRGNVVDGMFCAGDLSGFGSDTCKGDSGGPLTCYDNGSEVLYGIVSWGISCGRENKPGVYTKVTHYLDWIHRQIVRI